jgi:hypothetical protein
MNCSWCYKRGHNKLGCPELKEAAAPWIPKWEAYKKEMREQGTIPRLWKFRNRHPDDMNYRARLGLENYITTQERSTTKKRCNFCAETDHNKRTCPSLKKLKADIIKANAAFRHAMVEALKKTGQGVGSLVSGSLQYWAGNGWTESSGIGVVEKIDWNRFDLFSWNARSGSMWMTDGGGGEPLLIHWSFGQKQYSVLSESLPDPTDNENIFFKSYEQDGRAVVSPSSKVEPSDEWLMSKDKLFEDKLNNYFRAKKAMGISWFTEDQLLRKIINRWIKYGERYYSR